MKDLNNWLIGFVVVGIIFFTYCITREFNNNDIEDACKEDGWYLTQNYRLVCQDINE